MASATSTYSERLRLVDSFEEYNIFFSKSHFLFLVEESLELNRGGAEKLQYILGLASRCKSGVVSIELLAKQIDKEYSLPRLLQGQNGGAEGGPGREWEDMEIETEEGGGQEDEQQDGQEGEEEEPHVDDEVEKLIRTFGSNFFGGRRWPAVGNPFVVPGEGRLLDAHDIKELRLSTADDFAIAMPKPMSACLNGDPRRRKVSDTKLREQTRNYCLCKKVAVSFDGQVYRATDDEIEAALQNEEDAPSTDAATYLKAVPEVRRQHAIARARYIARRGVSREVASES